MADITLPFRASEGPNKLFDSARKFHAYTTPQALKAVLGLTESATTGVSFDANYPSRYVQIQEALTNLRMQTLLQPSICRPMARTLRIIFSGNLYHALNESKCIPLDITAELDNIVTLKEHTLCVHAVSGSRYSFDINDIAAYRIDDSFTYASRSECDSQTPTKNTLDYLMESIDWKLQLPYGLNAFLTMRASTTSTGTKKTDAFRDLVEQYYLYLLQLMKPSDTLVSRRVQVVPAYEPATPTADYPTVFIDGTLPFDNLIELDTKYLVINKIDGLPFIVKRSDIAGYRVQEVKDRIILSTSTRKPVLSSSVSTLIQKPIK